MPARHFAEMQVADAGANKPFHFVADLIKHAANLAVQALLQHDTDAGRPDRLQAREPGAFAIEKNAVEQFLTELRIPAVIKRDFIFLLHFVTRMCELLREIAVAREEKQSFGLGIEPADTKKAAEFCRQQIVNRIGRVRIAPGGNEPGGVVQYDGQRFGPPNELVIDFDVIAVFDLSAEVGAWLAVDCNPAAGDQLVAMPTRAESGGGEEAIEAQEAVID